MYQSKSKVFQLLVKAGTYKWNGETYETISTIDEIEDNKREENIGSEREDTKPTKKEEFWSDEYEEAGTSQKYGDVEEWLKNISSYERLKKKLENLSNSHDQQDENIIKSPQIHSPFQYSENSEESENSEKQQNIINTPILLQTPSTNSLQETPTSTGTNTPSSQGTLNILFNNPTPPQDHTPPLVNMADFNDQQFRNEQIRLNRIGDIDVECFYGKDSENPIEWFNKIKAVSDVRKWGKGSDGAGDDNGRLRAEITANYLRGEALKWYNGLAHDAIGHWDTNDADSFKTLFINAMWTEQKKEGWFYELQEIKKGSGETVEEYAKRFKQKKERADPTGIYPPRYIASLFTQGLDTRSRGKVLMFAPTTLEDAIKYAKQAELVERFEVGDTGMIEQERIQIQKQLQEQRNIKQ